MDRPALRVLVLCLNLAAAAPAGALVEVGHYEVPVGTSVTALDIEGHVALMAGTGDAVLVDVSNPRWPRLLGRLEVPGSVNEAALEDGIGFLANRELGLRILDVSDPREPRELALLGTSGVITGLAVRDGIAYLAADQDGLRIVDATDPSDPILVGSLDTPASARSVALKGSLAYVADRDSVRVVDVSDPTAPFEVGSLPTTESWHLAIEDDRGCLGGTDVEVLDLSDPAAPVSLGTVATRDTALRIEIAGDRCLAWGNQGALRVLDIADPTAPVEAGALANLGGQARVREDLAFVASGFRGLVVVDLSLPGYPKQLAALRLASDTMRDIAVRGGLVYATDPLGSFAVVDARDPSAPVGVGALFGARGNTVAVGDGVAYVGGDPGLYVASVADPAAPSILAHVPVGRRIRDLRIRNGLLYEAGDGGVRISDLSDPTSPVELGRTSSRQLDADDLALDGPTAFLTHRIGRLRTIDVSDPTQPVAFAHGLEFRSEHIGFQSGRAYAVGRDFPVYDLAVLDLDDPTDPVERARLRIAVGNRSALDLELSPARAFVAMRTLDQVLVADLSPPAPVWLGALELPDTIFDVELESGIVYVLSSETNPSERVATLHTFDLGPQYRPPRGIALDVRPGVDPNPVVPASATLLPVALLGSDAFDVDAVDVATLAFGPQRASAAERPVPLRDVNGDGFRDLVARFRVRDSGIAFGDDTACLTGSTDDGAPFRGCDAIVTSPGCGGGFQVALVAPAAALLLRRRRASA